MIDLRDKVRQIESGNEKYSPEGIERLKESLKHYDGEYKLIWWDEIKNREEKPKKLHNTGIKSLDNVIGGFREQQLITLAGDSGHGKTQMGLFLLDRLHELNPIMIPIEQSAEEIIDQRVENGFSVPNILSPKNLSTSVTTDWIEERIVEGIAKFNTRLVLIDHLGYIDSYGKDWKNKRENLAYRVGEVVRELKGMAKRWNVIIILLVHISQHDESDPPNRKDIKNSSDIIQESDIGIFIWRKNHVKKKIRIYDNRTLLSVQKNRRTGKNENIGLVFNPETGWYDEDNGWVKSLEELAKSEVDVDREFEEL